MKWIVLLFLSVLLLSACGSNYMILGTNSNTTNTSTGSSGDVTWSSIEGDQSVVNVGGFNNDIGYLTTITGLNISLLNNDEGYITDYTVTESDVTQYESSIDHNQLTNYDIAEHRTINDAGTSTTDLWSADKIQTELDNVGGGTNEIFTNGTLESGSVNNVKADNIKLSLPSSFSLGDTIEVYSNNNNYVLLSGNQSLKYTAPGATGSTYNYLAKTNISKTASYIYLQYIGNDEWDISPAGNSLTEKGQPGFIFPFNNEEFSISEQIDVEVDVGADDFSRFEFYLNDSDGNAKKLCDYGRGGFTDESDGNCEYNTETQTFTWSDTLSSTYYDPGVYNLEFKRIDGIDGSSTATQTITITN